MRQDPNDLDIKINAQMGRLMEVARKRREELERFLATQPAEIRCSRHPETLLQIDIENSQDATYKNRGVHTAGYSICPQCAEAQKMKQQGERLHEQGVPSNLLHATFDNWCPASEVERSHLEAVKEFAANKVGFLVMLGSVGNGKSHLGVATMRDYRRALFRKQSTLLRELRRTYRDHTAECPIELCQDTRLLVVDDIGISSGGRDEFPMLHEILDYRYGERLPTILTGNLQMEELREVIGERLADRLKESAFRILTFSGPSHRAERRSHYFLKPD